MNQLISIIIPRFNRAEVLPDASKAASLFMIKILDDTEYTKKLGQGGKQRINKKFKTEQHIEILDNII